MVSVKLAPPTRPYPEVSQQVQNLELERVKKESALEKDLGQAYKAELVDAKAKITKLVQAALGHKSMSFLQKQTSRTRESEDEFRVKVSVANPAVIDPAIAATVNAMESKRAGLEESLVKQACAEMSALTSLVLGELGHSLVQASTRRHRKEAVAFLQKTSSSNKAGSLPKQANLRIQATSLAFPRIADLIQELHCQRDLAENRERRHIIELELSLLQAENQMVSDALSPYV